MKKLFVLLIFCAVLTPGFSQKIQDNTELVNPYVKETQSTINMKLWKLSCSSSLDTKKSETIFRLLLEAGADANFIPADASTHMLINIISSLNNEKAKIYIEQLINAGADVNFTNKEENTILHEYLNRKVDFELLKMLVENGSEVNYRNEEKQCLIQDLISFNYGYEEIKYFLEKGSKPSSNGKEKVYEPVFSAISRKNPELLKLLVEYGASVKIKNDRRSSSALLYAVENGNKEIVQFLLENGWKITDVEKDSPTPAILAIINGKIDIAEMLIQKGDTLNKIFIPAGSRTKTHILHYLIGNGDKNGIKTSTALKYGADPMTVISEKGTAFEYASYTLWKYPQRDRAPGLMIIQNGPEYVKSKKYRRTIEEACILHDSETLKTLLNKYTPDKNSWSLLFLSVLVDDDRQNEQVELLLEKGIKPNYTVLYKVLQDNKTELAQRLVDSGMDLKHGNEKENISFLTYLIQNKNHYSATDIARDMDFLYRNGYTVHDKIYSSRFTTPEVSQIHFFASQDYTNNADFLKYVLDHGADPDELHDRKYPLGYAESSFTRFSMLLNYGADIDKEDGNGHDGYYYINHNWSLDKAKRILYPSEMYSLESRELTEDYYDDSKLTGTVRRGDKVTVIDIGRYDEQQGKKGWWTYIRTPDKNEGWIFGGALSKEKE